MATKMNTHYFHSFPIFIIVIPRYMLFSELMSFPQVMPCPKLHQNTRFADALAFTIETSTYIYKPYAYILIVILSTSEIGVVGESSCLYFLSHQ